MAMIDNLSQPQVKEIFKRLRALETASPMNSGAVGSGGFEVYGGGVITISNGGLDVTGTATISGTLEVGGTTNLTGPFSQSGTSTFTGTTNLNGPTNVAGNFTATGDTKLNGPTHINGNTDVTGTFTNNGPLNVNGAMKTTGTLSVEGATTLKNNLTVTAGGQITAGNTTITPSASNGGIEFVSGGGVGGNGGSVVVKGSGNAGIITGTSAAVYAGATQLTVNNGTVDIVGLPTVSGVTANLYMDPTSKQIKRIV